MRFVLLFNALVLSSVIHFFSFGIPSVEQRISKFNIPMTSKLFMSFPPPFDFWLLLRKVRKFLSSKAIRLQGKVISFNTREDRCYRNITQISGLEINFFPFSLLIISAYYEKSLNNSKEEVCHGISFTSPDRSDISFIFKDIFKCLQRSM